MAKKDEPWREIECFVHDLPGPPNAIDRAFEHCTNDLCRFIRRMIAEAEQRGASKVLAGTTGAVDE